MGGLFVDIFVEYIFRIVFHATDLLRSRKWPIAKATVLSADCPSAAYGCDVATVYYEYLVNGGKYGDTFGKPFILRKSGKDYATQFVKGADFNIRVKPDDPSKSVALWGPPSRIQSEPVR